MCAFQEIFSSIIAPGNFIEVSCFISKLFSFIVEIFNRILSCAHCLWKSANFNFTACSESSFSLNYSLTRFSSWLTISNKTFIFLCVKKRLVLFANIGLRNLVEFFKWLTYIRTGKDPNIELCETLYQIFLRLAYWEY